MENQKANIKGGISNETVERMTRFKNLWKEKSDELMNLTGVDGMVILAYEEKTGIHIFPTNNVTQEVATEMICQTAGALLETPKEQDSSQMELPLDS